jgi:hypothetical protein
MLPLSVIPGSELPISLPKASPAKNVWFGVKNGMMNESKTLPAEKGNVFAKGTIEYFEVTHFSVKASKGEGGDPIIRFKLKTDSHVDMDILKFIDKDIYELEITIDFVLRPQIPRSQPHVKNKIVYSAL